tara:strand:- start:3004 stop:3840 length:837 start_codon:yes stop_codon:yes gene_type:complete
LISNKSFVINGSREKDILLDISYLENQSLKSIVVFSHGFKGFKDWGPFNQMANLFAENNLFFIKFNYSYNGTSIQEPCEFVDLDAFGNNNFSTELDDLKLIIDWLFSNKFQNELDLNQINLVGHSRGGAISILKAYEDDRINKVVSWAAPSNFIKRMDESKLDIWKNEGVAYIFNSRTNQNMPLYYQFYEDCLKNKERINIENACRNLSIPHLAIHGSDDPTVLIEDVYDFKTWNEKTKVHEIKGANHVFNVSHPFTETNFPDHFHEVLEKTFNFLKG